MRTKGPSRPPLTHFLCIPLTTPASRSSLEASLAAFRSDFLAARPENVASIGRSCDAAVAWQRALRSVGTLHLTLGVMSLQTKRRLEEAMSVLEELDLEGMLFQAGDGALRHVTATEEGSWSVMNNCKAAAEDVSCGKPTPPAPLVISLRSLHPMQSKTGTSTLYAAPHDVSERLRRFCESLKDIFITKGLLVVDNRPLKLHATIVNTIYAKLEKRLPVKDDGLQQSSFKRIPADSGADKMPAYNMNQVNVHEHDDEQNIRQGLPEDDSEFQQEELNQNQPQKTPEQESRRSRRSKGAGPVRFDATALLEKYSDFTWVDNIALDRVAICEMGAKKTLNQSENVVGEAYQEVAVKKLPT